MNLTPLAIFFCALIVLASCSRGEKLFTIHGGEETGLRFQNTIIASDTFNALNYEYIYNGAGLGVADFNNDGMQDLFFGGNQVSSRLYLNQGGLKFQDITKEAGVTTAQWITGVSIIDINQDGFSDIYLSVGGKTTAANRRNLLFINQGLTDGVPVFHESARAFGLDSEGYSTMAAFFDYDKDGDNDMYLLNNWLESFNRNNLRPRRINGEAESNDQLFRNNGDNTFTDISRQAGILVEGYGLGLAICDINDDSWPDIYVANDFMSNDLLWINQRDGTFENQIGSILKHQTHNGMGVDIADFNNDALPDIIVVDMLPPGHERQKMMTPGQNYDHFHMSLDLGYQPQYMRNTLQLNRGKMPDGRILFSEIAFMAGVAATDWSWAPLLADFDNDGFKDIFIANGYRKDVTNLDFIFFGMENNPFGTPEARKNMWREQFSKVPDVKLSNYIFQNSGSLFFKDKTKEWGVEFPGFSNGAAYADLDNDGDLDLVTNNIDQEPTLYENNTNRATNKNHFLRLSSAESGSMNEKIWVYAGGDRQYVERSPYRGFQSTVEDHVHFGLGKSAHVDSVIIQWPDSMQLKLTHIRADTIISYSREDARRLDRRFSEDREMAFVPKHLADYLHNTGGPSDIKSTRTLLHELSRYGPCLAKGDANGDGLDDFYIGADASTPAQIFVQEPGGKFTSTDLETGVHHKDGSAVFFDADGDSDADLYVASAAPSGFIDPQPHRLYINDGHGKFTPTDLETGVHHKDGSAVFFDADGDSDADLYVASAAPSGFIDPQPHRLYINDGHGNFRHAVEALPGITTPGSCVEAADIDNDGDLDLFVGGRFKAGQYPLPPRSYILRNESGKFIDVTEQINPSLAESGMVSSAAWADINNDKKTDLIIVGEWQPIRIFRNDGMVFTELTSRLGLEKTHGWWNCIKAADLNKDGYMDFVVGNTGKNSFFRPGIDQPVQIVAKDFDNNRSIDPIVTYYNPVEKERYIVHNRLVLIDQIPGMKKRFENFSQYATRPFEDVFTDDELEGAFEGRAYKLESVILINSGRGDFTITDLPDIAQLSVINDVLIDDVNQDGSADIMAIGNMYGQETLFGRYNASLGTVLLGDGNLNWQELPPRESGFVVDGDARYIESLRTSDGLVYVVTNHNDSIQFFSPPRRAQAPLPVTSRGRRAQHD